MSTILKLKKDYFTLETTQLFLKELEIACKTMNASLFEKLFINYDLYYDEEYREVLDMIIGITSNWYFPERGTKLHQVQPFESHCIFCEIGKKVNGYEWTYSHCFDEYPSNMFVYSNKIGFILKYENEILAEFGICNSYV